MVNETFINTTLYGLTSHYSLVIQSSDNWTEPWYVKVFSIGDKTWQFQYTMPEKISPWKDAIVSGQANTIDEARDFLIIAMTESEGWEGNKELRKLYNKFKRYKTNSPEFRLWLEFEEVEPGNWDIENGFCNIHVYLEDGRKYGLTVWTYEFLGSAVNMDKETGQHLHGLYQKPPDLFVKELTRKCIEEAIEDLLKVDDLEKVLNLSVYSRNKLS